jgi:triacylglycerol lipase
MTGVATMSRKLIVFVLLAMTAFGLAPVAGASADTVNPVIIVAGTFSPSWANDFLAARLRNDGYQVWIYVLPDLGLGDIHDAANGLDPLVDAVRAGTGADRVDLIGHSQGGLVARDYVKHGAAGKVGKVIGLGTPNQGTTLANLATLLGLGDCAGFIGCAEMAIGSGYLGDLNAGDDSIDDVQYTNIATVFDEIATPYSTAFLDAGDGNIDNATVQSWCWFRFVGHLGLIADGTVYSGIRQALEGRQSIDFDCWAW